MSACYKLLVTKRTNHVMINCQSNCNHSPQATIPTVLALASTHFRPDIDIVVYNYATTSVALLELACMSFRLREPHSV